MMLMQHAGARTSRGLLQTSCNFFANSIARRSGAVSSKQQRRSFFLRQTTDYSLRRQSAPRERGAALFSATATAAAAAPGRAVGYWLVGCGAMVAGMVTVGGLTRLTKSGLSMTDWKVQGGLPPTTEEAWMLEFQRYRQFPEWQQRQSMTLDEFKIIFAWEYGHRMLGRVVGVAFVVPLAYFAARGSILPHLRGRLALLLGLGGTQGLVGWWMVKSGLENVDLAQHKEIRVSPYRLATHLGMAFTTFALLTWTALDVLRPSTPLLSEAALRHGARLRPLAMASAVLVFGTAMSGAFVAGNDAGRAYNTFPLMDGEWVPEGIMALTPAYRNFFENTATVQFDHRMLAYATATSVAALTSVALFAERGTAWRTLPAATRLCLGAGALAATAQVSLGVATLLLYVPVCVAATHQFGSLVLLTTMIGTVHSLRFAAPKAIIRAAAAVAPTTTVSLIGSATSRLAN